MLLRESRQERRKIRHRRIRRRIVGTAERPRLSVFRSLKHIYAQIIDDTRGHTLVAASTREPEIAARVQGLKRVEQGRVVGQALAQRAREKGIVRVVFDRGGYAYHGRVKALAEGAREGGLEF
ncbi:MAG: 50S ribosomal protein L18 [candidate division GAL15 bacterium]